MPDRVIARGPRVWLAPFTAAQIAPRYLGWLSDPEVNRYSRRRDLPPETPAGAVRWLEGLAANERVLAIHVAEWDHVGNLMIVTDAANDRADVSIVVGERAVWGRGIGSEALYLATRLLLRDEGINRVDAGTCNPAFVRAVEKLGWRVEGVMRERVKLGGVLHDYTVLAQIRREFRELRQYEFEENAA